MMKCSRFLYVCKEDIGRVSNTSTYIKGCRNERIFYKYRPTVRCPKRILEIIICYWLDCKSFLM